MPLREGSPGASQPVLVELRTLLGGRLIEAPAALEAMRADRSGLIAEGTPIAIAEVCSTGEVAAVLRAAHTHGVPVVPRGAGTGLAGGATAGAGELVLSLSRMTAILEIDPVDQVARVEAGVINADLDAAAAVLGLRFAPDPASRAISTIGGNIATNAGGLLCAKYGVTREAVLGLTAVLADGRVLRAGRRTLKGVTGYDLPALLTGSEGTLAVITEATVRLVPRPSTPPLTLGAILPTLDAALDLCAEIQRAGQPPALLELLDPRGLRAVTTYLPLERLPGAFAALKGAPLGPAAVIVQWDAEGAETAADRIVHAVGAAAGESLLLVGEEAGETLLEVRRAMNPALPTGSDVLIEDVCVPRTKLREMYAAIAQIEAETGIEIPAIAHAGDGNLHPHLAVADHEREPGGEIPDRVWDAAARVFQAALALGGTLSGEHGVGVLKAKLLLEELGDLSLDLQRGVKRVFDPEGRLNPGKVFLSERTRVRAAPMSGRMDA